jgi:transposase
MIAQESIMSLQPQLFYLIPEETARVAQAAFPKGNIYMRMRDQLGPIYADQLFASLFPPCGQPALSPWRLALTLVMQFVEGLSDRQAADAVRGRLDWKYALALELTDPGFDFSVLSEFRDRLIDGALEHQLLDAMLTTFRDLNLLKARGKQRTDATHVLAAIRNLNRLESVTETLRAALNAVAELAPDWLVTQITAEWLDRYGPRAEEYRLPKGEDARKALAETVGADGMHLLTAIYALPASSRLRDLAQVETLRQVWVHQYYFIDEQLRWRSAADLPPAGTRFDSPYDPEARYGSKRSTSWTGYKVHVSETCEPDAPHLITNIETTLAHIADVSLTAPIHDRLAKKDLLPNEHIVDAGYMDATLLVASETDHQVQLLGPVRPDSSWQAQANKGYDISCFTIDWEAQKVTCPQGQLSRQWIPAQDAWGNATIHVQFARSACLRCTSRSDCTRAKRDPRELTLRPQTEHEALQAARQRQQTLEWKEQYNLRAGIEGTLSQGTRAFELRRSRYIGLARTHLQHLLTAAAINLVRFDAWITDKPRAKTRTSHFEALRPKVAAAA